MKRTRLKRRTPLKARKPWRRKKSAWKKADLEMAAQRHPRIHYEIYEAKKPRWLRIALDVIARLGENNLYCERCRSMNKTKKIEIIRMSNLHHMRKRSQGGHDNPENIALLCGPMEFWGKKDNSCHSLTESQPKQMREEGWLK